ncbi:FG-GAP repeat domain-containing protein [Alteromonas sp. AMM-1]|uniref:FG-GAP repeat domain-containing protein n=1 Tax=Alteromonas sp. AMM-1 TaxID=3394233 RepID=UPI0039A68327
MRTLRVFITLFATSLLVACGGGSESSTDKPAPVTPPPVVTPPPEPTNSEIIAQSYNYDEEEVKTAAIALADERYLGLTSPADVTEFEAFRKAYKLLFPDYDNDYETKPPGIIFNRSWLDNGDEVELIHSCHGLGTVTVSGERSAESRVRISQRYEDCTPPSEDYALNGQIAITIYQFEESVDKEFSLYFDNLNWQENGIDYALTGFMYVKNGFNLGVNSNSDVIRHYTLTIGSESFKINTQGVIEDGAVFRELKLTGEIYIGSKGKLAVDYQGRPITTPGSSDTTFTFEGNHAGTFEIAVQLATYLIDTNDDGELDAGAHFRDLHSLLYGDLTDKSIVSLTELSAPPYAGNPVFDRTADYFASAPITVEEGEYADSDTDLEDLEIWFHWYIDGVKVEDVTGNTFPAYTIGFGEALHVSMVVSDGITTMESDRVSVPIQDSPTQVNISDFPAQVSPGEIIRLQVEISDADIGAGNIATLLSGPEGAFMDDEGYVNWTAPTQQLFQGQTYYFNLGIINRDGTSSVLNIQETHLAIDKELPFSWSLTGRSGPFYLDDIDSDGYDDHISATSLGSIVISDFKDNKFSQKWNYPYALPGKQKLEWLVYEDINGDGAKDIIAFQANTISVIEDLNKPAYVLWRTGEAYIKRAVISDFDNDSLPEIALLVSDNLFITGNYELLVIELDGSEIFRRDLPRSYEMMLANVDNDIQLEVITDSGFVVDTQSWITEWELEDGFGSELAVGDVDGDGISEIIASSNGITIYSGQSQTILYSQGNLNGVEVCALDTTDVDADDRFEIIASPCDDEEHIWIYRFTGDTFEILSGVISQDSNTRMVLTGDVDRDGKLEFVWANNSALVFTAELEGTTLTFNDTLEQYVDEYSSPVGWTDWLTASMLPTFVLTSYQNYQFHSLLVSLDQSAGTLIRSEPFSNTGFGFSSSTNKVLVDDFNGDGLDELFLTFSSERTERFSVLRALDQEYVWQTPGDMLNGSIVAMSSVDVTGDGNNDAIILTYKDLLVFDITNQTFVNGSQRSWFYADDIITVDIDGSTAVYILDQGSLNEMVIRDGNLLYTDIDWSFSCEEVVPFYYDSDSQPELLCVEQASTTTKLKVLEITPQGIELVHDNTVGARVQNLIVDPRRENNQQFIGIYTEDNSDNEYAKFNVVSIDSNGGIITKSPDLSGTIESGLMKAYRNSQGNLELQISTSTHMYHFQ